MPRRYRGGRRRRSIGQIVRRRTGSKMAGNVAQTAMAGYRLAKRLARLVNVEIKHYTTNSITQVDYNGGIIDLCDPAQGQDQDERLGDSIKPLHLTIRGNIRSDATGVSTQPVRIIIFRYKDENGVVPTIDDILDPNLTGTSSCIHANKNWDKKFHSKILFDKLYVVKYNATDGEQDKLFKFDTKLFGHINWSDSTTTQEGGGLYMLVVSQAAATANAPTVQWVSQVSYTDN